MKNLLITILLSTLSLTSLAETPDVNPVRVFSPSIAIDPITPIVDKVVLIRYQSDLKKDTYASVSTLVTEGYMFNSFMGYLSRFPEYGTIPFYGCEYNGDRYATTKFDCGGGEAQYVTTLGYLFKDRVRGSKPIYSCTSYTGEFYPSVSANCDNAGTNGGTFGYILR